MDKVLIIDDEALIRESVTELLEWNGYHVISASNAKTGILLAHEESPDIILVDIMMPGIDGISLVKYLKSNPSFRYTPIIFLSAKSSIDDFNAGMNNGADDYLFKPFSKEQLIKSLKLKLEKYKAIREQINPWSLSVESVYFEAKEKVNTNLKEILNAVNGITDDLNKGESVNQLEVIRTSAHQLKNIFENKEWLSRLKEESLELPQRYFGAKTDLACLMEFTLPLKFPKSLWHKVELHVHPGYTSLIAELTEKIISELLTYALEHKEEDSLVKVTGCPSPMGYRLSIENKGVLPQIDPEELKRAYLQSKNMIKQKQCKGIGLVMVISLCESLKIPLKIKHVKNGNQFMLILPNGS